MFTLIEDYDVQETRRLARDEGKLEGELEGELKGKMESKLEDTVNIIKELQLPISRATAITKLPENKREQLIKELKRERILYTE